jgi:hypothetical protein
MVTRGYPSLSFLYEAAETIRNTEKPTFLYYFGDRDPSGVDIPRHVEESIRDLAPYADMHFELVAVTPEQIEEYELPTRPTKQTDSRARNFDGFSVEVDAIPVKQLREMVEDCITQHIDHDELERNQLTEQAERESGAAYIDRMAEILEGT